MNMTLKDLRISKNLTQAQTAILFGISLRSYKQYENENSKIGTIKYNYMLSELDKIGFIDEEHGILSVDDIKRTVSEVFAKHQVDYCYLFGSYASNSATDASDVDLLVCTKITGMAFYGLAEELREALHKKVDLLNVDQLYNNPTLLNEILSKGVKIYG